MISSWTEISYSGSPSASFYADVITDPRNDDNNKKTPIYTYTLLLIHHEEPWVETVPECWSWPYDRMISLWLLCAVQWSNTPVLSVSRLLKEKYCHYDVNINTYKSFRLSVGFLPVIGRELQVAFLYYASKNTIIQYPQAGGKQKQTNYKLKCPQSIQHYSQTLKLVPIVESWTLHTLSARSFT